jgi:hypothetical protein
VPRTPVLTSRIESSCFRRLFFISFHRHLPFIINPIIKKVFSFALVVDKKQNTPRKKDENNDDTGTYITKDDVQKQEESQLHQKDVVVFALWNPYFHLGIIGY